MYVSIYITVIDWIMLSAVTNAFLFTREFQINVSSSEYGYCLKTTGCQHGWISRARHHHLTPYHDGRLALMLCRKPYMEQKMRCYPQSTRFERSEYVRKMALESIIAPRASPYQFTLKSISPTCLNLVNYRKQRLKDNARKVLDTEPYTFG